MNFCCSPSTNNKSHSEFTVCVGFTLHKTSVEDFFFCSSWIPGTEKSDSQFDLKTDLHISMTTGAVSSKTLSKHILSHMNQFNNWDLTCIN